MTITEADAFIKANLKKWNYSELKVEWIPNRKSFLGGYQFYRTFRNVLGKYQSQSQPPPVRILLTPRILKKDELFREVFLHELAHALDHRERGSFQINTRNSYHGVNWRKWCKVLGIPARRYIDTD